MSRRRLAAWLVALPLMVAGSQVAHVFAYRLVYPQTELRLRELVASGHGYMAHMPLFLGLGAAVELIALFAVVAGSIRRTAAPVPAWAFGLLPPLGFAVQEFLERWLSGAALPWWIVMQPTFRVGLLLQLPFGIAAYLVARLLLRMADGAGRALRGASTLPRLVGRVVGWSISVPSLPRISVLAGGHSGRSPPGSAVASPSCVSP